MKKLILLFSFISINVFSQTFAIPTTGTTKIHPLIGPIEYRGIQETALVDTVSSMIVGAGNKKNLNSATIYGYSQYDPGGNIFHAATDNSTFLSRMDYNANGIDIQGGNVSRESDFFINSDGSMQAVSTFTNWAGLSYDITSSGHVGTFQTQYSLLDRVNGDARWLGINNGWKIAGNSGTTISNFIGTTDNVSFRFRTNNVQRAILDSIGRLQVPNHVSIGSGGAFYSTSPVVLDNEEIFTGTAPSISRGYYGYVESQHSSGTGQIYGLQLDLKNSSSGTTVPGSRGLFIRNYLNSVLNFGNAAFIGANIQMITTSTQTGTVLNAEAVSISTPVFTGSKPTTNMGLYVQNMGVSGVTTSSGLRIDAQSGSTNNYGVIVGGGLNGFGTLTPTSNMHIVGSSGATLRIQDGNEGVTKVLTSDANGNASWASFASSLVATAPLSISNDTISISKSTTSINGYLSSTDWNIFNNKQTALSGTGYVYQSGSTTSYTNSIPNSSLANSTISGISLGSNLSNHTVGYGLSGSSYNGSGAIAWTADSTVLASKLYVTAKTAQFITSTSTNTLTNKSITSPTITVGSDATGDMYYNGGSGAFTRLAAGGAGKFLMFNGTGSAPIVSTLVLPNAIQTGNVVYATTTNTYGSTSNLNYIGGTLKAINAIDVYGMVAKQSGSGAGAFFGTYDNNDKETFFGQYGTTYAGNYGSTSIPFANSAVFKRTGTTTANSGGIVFSEGYTSCLIGSTSTNMGWVQSNIGLKIDQMSNLHTAPTYALDVNNGDIALATAGKKLRYKTGVSNCSAGTGTLSGGTVTISTTAVTSSSLIFITDTGGSNIGSLSVGTVTNGVSFVVNSNNVLDGSTFNWFIIEPY